MTSDDRLELDIIFAAEREQRVEVKRRASEVIDTLPPAQRLAALTELQAQLLDLTPEDQIGELRAWLERVAQQ